MYCDGDDRAKFPSAFGMPIIPQNIKFKSHTMFQGDGSTTYIEKFVLIYIMQSP